MDRVGVEPTTSATTVILSFFNFSSHNLYLACFYPWQGEQRDMIMNKKQSSVVVLVAIIAAALVVTSSMTTAPVAATTTTSASSGIELSSQPVYQDQLRVVSQNPINETQMRITFSGNGTLTLPNTTQTINTTSNGSALISFMTLSVQGMETIRTQDGETATATLYEIDRQPATTGESKGIVIAVVNTNATSGMLAPLNGMILAGLDDIQTTT